MPIVAAFYHNYDPTGVSINNAVSSERQINVSSTMKIIRPNYGAFYTESVRVYLYNATAGTHTELIKNVDFVCTDILIKETFEIGKEICSGILITKQIASTLFDISYQSLGGSDSVSVPDTKAAFESLGIGQAPVPWSDILAKPKEFYPSAHLHDAQDFYGVEYFTRILDSLNTAIATGNGAVHQLLFDKLAIVQQQAALDMPSNNEINSFVAALDNLKATSKELVEKIAYLDKKQQVSQVLLAKAEYAYNNR